MDLVEDIVDLAREAVAAFAQEMPAGFVSEGSPDL
jgi:hypothetical protein